MFNPEGVAWHRRSVLFNLYAFDSIHTDIAKTPSLTIDRSEFRYFMSGHHEALILVETTNLFLLPEDSTVPENDPMRRGFIKSMGVDNGANIHIRDSTFEYSRFCKGMLSYRPAYDIIQDFGSIFSYQSEAELPIRDETCSTCKIIFETSMMKFLNYGSQIRALRPLFDLLSTARNATQYDSSGLSTGFTFPLYQNHGSVLNVQDFRGPIEFRGSTISQNIVNLPDVFNGPFSFNTSADLVDEITQGNLPQFNYHYIDYYYNSDTRLYELAVCRESSDQDLWGSQQAIDRYLMVQGIQNLLSRSGLDELYDMFERHSAVYISRNTMPVIFKDNTFEENIGLFGGAVSINSPNWSEVDPLDTSPDLMTVPSASKPYIIFKDNTFNKNMAYFSGSAVHIRHVKLEEKPLESCGISYFEANTF